MAGKIYLYPRWIRLWHILNALTFLFLIISGISLEYSGKHNPVISFHHAVSIHNFGGILLTFLYLFFVFGNLFTDNGQHYHIINKKEPFKRLKKQFLYYICGMFKGEEPPYKISVVQKFNPLQHFIYIGTMYIGMPLIIITGWAMLYPEITIKKIFGVNGLLVTDQLHVIIGFLLSVFMIIHIYFASIGKKVRSNYEAIITGYFEEE